MRGMKDRIPFAVNNITCVILLSLFCNAASAVEFNTDVLDAADKKNIDFTRFSEAGYVLPGQYLLDVIVNVQSIVRIFMGCREWIFVLIPERAYYASICRRPGLSILMPPGCLLHAGTTAFPD